MVTQGNLENEEKKGNTIMHSYTSDIPLPQFSINAGNYIVKHVEVDSIDFYAYYSDVHRRYAEFFSDTTVVEDGIKELLEVITLETGLEYPYPSFSLIEVPLDFKTGMPQTF